MDKKAHLVQDFLCDYWNDKSKDSKDELFDLFSPSLIIDSPIAAKEVGNSALISVSENWARGFPDMKVSQIEIERHGDAIITNWRSTATHQCPFKGLDPTDRRVDYPGETIFFFKGNRVVRYFCKIDMVEVYRQLGYRLAEVEYDEQEVAYKNERLLIEKIQRGVSPHLTKREVQLLSLYLMGFNSKQVGVFCSISHRTVESHISRALQELGCQNKHQCLEKILSMWMLPVFQDLAKLLLEQNGAAKKSLSIC